MSEIKITIGYIGVSPERTVPPPKTTGFCAYEIKAYKETRKSFNSFFIIQINLEIAPPNKYVFPLFVCASKFIP
jgi:hypothetical protein